MSNIHFASLLRAATFTFLLTGLSILIMADAAISNAASSVGPGTFITQAHQAAEPTLAGSPITSVFVETYDPVQVQLLLGMLIILAGFFFHALYIVRFDRADAQRKYGKKGSIQRKFARGFAQSAV